MIGPPYSEMGGGKTISLSPCNMPDTFCSLLATRLFFQKSLDIALTQHNVRNRCVPVSYVEYGEGKMGGIFIQLFLATQPIR